MHKHNEQVADCVAVVGPTYFRPNPQTSADNEFHDCPPDLNLRSAQESAENEFGQLVAVLQANGVQVISLPAPSGAPDAVFPNNWLSTHSDGTIVVYPLKAKNRRIERSNLEILRRFLLAHQFTVTKVLDFSHLENRGYFLEGTGSLVLDRKNCVAYACLSERTHPLALTEVSSDLGYTEVVAFTARGNSGKVIYHTNVMMYVGDNFAVACLDCIEEGERDRVLDSLLGTGKVVIRINKQQLGKFCGNLLQLNNAQGESLIFLSTSAFNAFSCTERAVLAEHGRLVAVDIPTIEKLGGGSVRCMLAEIFLPKSIVVPPR